MDQATTMERANETVRSTDWDAVSCRYQCMKKGYIEDPFIEKMVQGLKTNLPLSKKVSFNLQRNFERTISSPKMPVINRGTYLRTSSIDKTVREFVAMHPRCQIISVGAGSDTRAFKILDNNQSVSMYEYDFPVSVKIKKLSILNDETLCGKLEVPPIPVNVGSHEEFDKMDSTLKGKRYQLKALDLDHIEEMDMRDYDTGLPTLVLAECVLCYLSTKTSDKVIEHFKHNFSKCCMVIYDPMGGCDNFGRVMVSNLSVRGIHMPNLMLYNTLEAQKVRFTKLGVDKYKLNDLQYIYDHWVDQHEKQRIGKLDWMDELEEFILMNKHYCLLVAFWGIDFKTDLPFLISA